MLSKMLRKFGYVTRAELQCVQSANWLLKQGIESGSRIIDNLRYRLQESEAEVEISRNLLTKCAEVRDQLREELSIVTTERDIALAKVEDAEYRAWQAEHPKSLRA